MDQILLAPAGEPPAYLANGDIRAMFHWALDCLDKQPPDQRTRSLSRQINAKHFPTLFNPEFADDDIVLWELLKRCQHDGLIRIEGKRRDPTQDAWVGTRIIFCLDREADLRQWLDRPLVSPGERQWQLALKKWAHAFQRADLLTYREFDNLNQPAEEIVSRLAAIAELVSRGPLTARQVSARLFWGHSKALEGKEQKLCDALGLPDGALLERMLLVEVAFPAGPPAGMLMLENLDSYFSACSGNWPDCRGFIKIYTQGFRGTAARIRNPAFARLHYADQALPEPARLAAFRDQWFQAGAFSYPVYFCGDMDWAGLSIFRGLKPLFPGLEPWKPGYEQMLRAAEQGCWHPPEMATKAGQSPLDTTGDVWLDEHILAFLKEQPRFVDQEVI